MHHYSSLAVDIAETVIRALARIVFIEDSMTSLKVCTTFYNDVSICNPHACSCIVAHYLLHDMDHFSTRVESYHYWFLCCFGICVPQALHV